MRIPISLSLLLSLCSTHVSAMLLDPKLMSVEKGNWVCYLNKYKNEKFLNVKYQDKIIFRVLERIEPGLNRILMQAQEENGYISLPTINTDILITEIHELDAVLIVDMMLFSPDQINLREHTPLARKKYYTIELFEDECKKQRAFERRKKISKRLFIALSKAKVKAKNNGASVAIDMDLFIRKEDAKINPHNFIRVMKSHGTN